MDEELETLESIVSALRRIIRAVDLHSKRLASRYGLTGPQLVVLLFLNRHGPQTTGGIARGVSLGQATVSEMLDRLEARHLIRRRQSRTDRRSVTSELTRSGRAAIKEAPPLLQEHFVRELRRLEEWERTLILSTLQRVAGMMQAREIEASPVLVTGPIGVSAEQTAEFHVEPKRRGRARSAGGTRRKRG